MGESESDKGIPSRFRLISASKGKIHKRRLQPSRSSTGKKNLHTTLEAYIRKSRAKRQIQKATVLLKKTASLLDEAKIQERQAKQKEILAWVQKEAEHFLLECEDIDEDLDESENEYFDEDTTEQEDSMDTEDPESDDE